MPARAPATGGVLALTETYAPGWRRVGGNAEHVPVQGWMNAWPLQGDAAATLTYAPARRARLALYVFPFAAALGAGSIAWSLRRSRRIAAAGRMPSAR